MKRNDVILLVCVLAVAALLLGIGSLVNRGEIGAWVVISVKGKEYGKFALSENRTVEIMGSLGTNYLVISDGTARMEEAACPDHYCINQGEIGKAGQQIICLPNGIVVEITGGESLSLDATVY